MVALGENERDRMEFVLDVIKDHEGSPQYRTAKTAESYYRGFNTTIMSAQKFLFDRFGRKVPDYFSPNSKISCHYYRYLITQAVLHLLGNGVSFVEDKTKETLGKTFDNNIVKLATFAKNDGVAFGFWNNDHLEVFSIASGEGEPVFAPLYDEETGQLGAGVRYWKLAEDKPLRMTLYEQDGLTEYIKRPDEDVEVYKEKRAYLQVVETSEAMGEIVTDGGNYTRLPIFPLYNVGKKSDLEGNQETIDALDLMLSDLINNISEANVIYWIIRNAGGMEDVDDQLFLQRLKTLHVAHLEDNEEVDAHTVEVPFEASETSIERLRSQLFDNFMALDINKIAGGADTATRIKAMYEPLTNSTDVFELQVTEFILQLLDFLGIEDVPTYTRSVIVNQQELVQNVLSTAGTLPQDYIVKKLLEIFGDIDKTDEIMDMLASDDYERFNRREQQEPEEEQATE